MPRNLWTRDELIVTLALYFQLPFGRLNHGTPEVKRLAELLGRSDNSIALRLANFAACDPYILSTGRHGMAGGESICQPIWDEFANDKQKLFFEAEKIKSKLTKKPVEKILGISNSDLRGETREVIIKQRINQNVFRAMILNNYRTRCAITGIDIPELLIASHIIPWAKDEENRLNPSNGICLSALYDKAFDQGLISIDNDYKILLSKRITEFCNKDYFEIHFASINHKKIELPEEHLPNPAFLEWHRDCVFDK